ncbi:hypothetical protein NCAS_0E03850 [Naumovozyma castellii]|uniref:2',3'-cyclic-nucleotide 3'-phosphodiesterase n=1 Tax=Naumovozyma castellii TaxID=27288 RepID=G0VG36_NAUCA|nr:hypothetical protein NCAS_0E03850 [Naumovozyma castellii CBS 4309]CCC70455.1 hypothetical protein NCAS_0E03850 [Naumovozyma castellii CBS 4309]
MSVALWFCPAPGTPAYETLTLLIQSLQTLFPDSPVFEPHVTVVTNLSAPNTDEVNKILMSCVAAMNSIKSSLIDDGTPLITFQKCSIGRTFFKKIILECQLNSYLISIAQIMREMFVESDQDDSIRREKASNWVRDEFKPHVSLLYSEISRISPAFSKTIEQRIEDTLDVRMTLVDGSLNPKWEFDRIPANISWGIPGVFKVVRCEGPIEEWEVLGATTI